MFRVCVATVILATLQLHGLNRAAYADTVVCNNGPLPQQAIRLGGPPHTQSQPDLLIAGPCDVPPGTYYYGNVNIIGGGGMAFTEMPYAATHVWASAILVENGGALTAGSAGAPFGVLGGTLTIHLYGPDQSGNSEQYPGLGVPCRTRVDAMRGIGPCGIPLSVWNTRDPASMSNLPGGVAGHFVAYEPLPGDGAAEPLPGYFGYKVLGVSYGGTLALFGAKGADYDAAAEADPSSTGLGWVHLAEGAAADAGATQFPLERAVQGNWMPGDLAVMTPTDGDPAHAEEITIDGIDGATVMVHRSQCRSDDTDAGCPGLQWPHAAGSGSASGAAVALLRRSIRIVSEGDAPGQSFDAAVARDRFYGFGGFTIARQGFARFQMQGVELYRLGQAGRRDRYPITFYAVGATASGTFVKDTVVHDTMIYAYALRPIAGVALQRDVGYRSAGHLYLAVCTYVPSQSLCQ